MVSATKGMLEGVSGCIAALVPERIVGPTVEDVHDARLLESFSCQKHRANLFASSMSPFPFTIPKDDGSACSARI